MRAQLCRRAAKKIKHATSPAEESVSIVRLDPRRVKVVAYESLEIRHNLSMVSITTTVHDRKIATLTFRGASIARSAL